VKPLSTHTEFNSQQWSDLRADAPLTLSKQDLQSLKGFNDTITLEEVSEIYLPLSRLLNLYVAASQGLYRASDTFLGKLPAKVPYVIGVAGSVAVGKSTAARVLRTLLARWPDHPRVDLITTDGFLYPNSVLEERGLMERKGFPESYDRKAILDFLYNVKSGTPQVPAPVYSHLTYDIVPEEFLTIEQPDILIVEGLTVLQTGLTASDPQDVFVSDFFDFSVYLDAEISDLKTWYVDRFLALRATAFSDVNSYFHQYKDLSDSEAISLAEQIWVSINEKNLLENIIPTRERADLILTKVGNHRVDKVRLRKL